MKRAGNWKNRLVNLAYIAALAVVLAPILRLSHYNVASADDWSYGRDTYAAVRNGGGLLAVFGAAFRTAANQYGAWEGRFVNSFLASLQPGIWGERCYACVAWLMIGGLLAGELVLVAFLIRRFSPEGTRWSETLIPLVMPGFLLQILFTPSPIESFYWYTGAVNYTFVYALSLIFLALFLALTGDGMRRGTRIAISVCAAVLAILVGGDNYSTSLSTLLALAGYYVFLFLTSRKRVWAAFRRTWFLAGIVLGSICVCLLAPGNQARMNSNFGGQTVNGPLTAVVMSLWRSFTNILSWTDLKIVLLILLILPFLGKLVCTEKYAYPLPGLFTFLTFGVYASQMTPNLFVDGTAGGGRAAALLYYTYHLWVFVNVWYWLGWLAGRNVFFGEKLRRIIAAVKKADGKYILLYCAVLGLLLAGWIYAKDLKRTSVYGAYRDLRQGWAEEYGRVWDERFEVLRDERVKEVVFTPVKAYPRTMMYTDLQGENGYLWVNSACAKYYGKDKIVVVEE